MARFTPGEHALLLVSMECSCGKVEHLPLPAGTEVIVHAIGPFGPGYTVLHGIPGFLHRGYDYWIHGLDVTDPWNGYLCQESELSKLQTLTETIEQENDVEQPA